MSGIRLTVLIAPSIALLIAILFGAGPFEDPVPSIDKRTETRRDAGNESTPNPPIWKNSKKEYDSDPVRKFGPRAQWPESEDRMRSAVYLPSSPQDEPEYASASFTMDKEVRSESLEDRLYPRDDPIFDPESHGPYSIVKDESEQDRGFTEIINRDSLSQNNCSRELILKVMDRFTNPMDSWVCTKSFAAGGAKRAHQGIDLAASAGAPVYSIGEGKVVFAGSLPRFHDYGKIVLIDHGCGVFSLYGHITPTKVLEKRRRKISEGWTYIPVFVDAGFRIASLSGRRRSGEATTGPHLHLEIMVVKKSSDRVKFTYHNPAHCLPLLERSWFHPLLPEVFATRTGERKLLARGRQSLSAARLRGARAILETLDYPFVFEPGYLPGQFNGKLSLYSNVNDHGTGAYCPNPSQNMLRALDCEQRERVSSLFNTRYDSFNKHAAQSPSMENTPALIEKDYSISSYMRLEESLSNSINLRIGVASVDPIYDE